MKTRALKPAYWKDPVMASWTPAQREFYMGCWMLADDSGVMRSDVWEIAAELYPYRPTKAREKLVAALWLHVLASGKVLMLTCGRHAKVPAVEEHPMGGSKSEHIRKEHEHRC